MVGRAEEERSPRVVPDRLPSTLVVTIDERQVRAARDAAPPTIAGIQIARSLGRHRPPESRRAVPDVEDLGVARRSLESRGLDRNAPLPCLTCGTSTLRARRDDDPMTRA